MTQAIMGKAEIVKVLDIQAFHKSEVERLGAPDNKDQTRGICPFHDDKAPSCSFEVKAGHFNCFGCDARGSIFDFYMKKHGVDFRTASFALSQVAEGVSHAKGEGGRKRKPA